jgi:predicted site-specific integrase-resolvase
MNSYLEPKGRALVSKAEAAALAGVNIRTVKRWAVAGRITEKRDPITGRPWYLRREIEKVRNGHQKST